MQDITKNQTSERNEKQRKTAREIIEQYDGPPVRIMEVCGTHTHEIFRLGIRKLLPKQVELISGPGCLVELLLLESSCHIGRRHFVGADHVPCEVETC